MEAPLPGMDQFEGSRLMSVAENTARAAVPPQLERGVLTIPNAIAMSAAAMATALQPFVGGS